MLFFLSYAQKWGYGTPSSKKWGYGYPPCPSLGKLRLWCVQQQEAVLCEFSPEFCVFATYQTLNLQKQFLKVVRIHTDVISEFCSVKLQQGRHKAVIRSILWTYEQIFINPHSVLSLRLLCKMHVYQSRSRCYTYSITSEHNIKQIVDFFRHAERKKVGSACTANDKNRSCHEKFSRNRPQLHNKSTANLQQIVEPYSKSTTNLRLIAQMEFELYQFHAAIFIHAKSLYCFVIVQPLSKLTKFWFQFWLDSKITVVLV